MDLRGKLSRLERLEASNKQKHGTFNSWPPHDCDPRRRLAKYAAWFSGQPWQCKGTAEKKAMQVERLARYREYFEGLK